MIHWTWLFAAFYGGVCFAWVLFALLSAVSDTYPAPRYGRDPERLLEEGEKRNDRNRIGTTTNTY